MATILITGSNGFLAHYLIKQLVDSEYQIIATAKGENLLPFQSDNLIYESMDFTDAEQVKKVFNKYKPDIVVHSGAMSKPDDCEQNKEIAFRTNVTASIYLSEQAARFKSFFIFLSTDFIFSGEKGMYKEEDEPAPVNYYGETKLLAEMEIKKYPYDWAIVRTVLVYGKPFHTRQNILTSVANALRKGEPLKIFDDQVRTPTYVEDLAGAIIEMIKRHTTGIYHISGEDIYTPYQMALAVANHLNLDASLITKVTEQEFQQPARRPLKTGFNISKAKQELNYNPTPFKEGLKKTFLSSS
jgi:dTDP-4-dehydrorhamnose reductase